MRPNRNVRPSADHGAKLLEKLSATSQPNTLAGGIMATASQDGTVTLWNARTGAQIKPKIQTVQFENFADISHALWTLIVACLSGAVASFLARKNNDESVSTATISQTRL